MLTQGPLVISVPARELAQLPVPGSVFDLDLLRTGNISEELKIAVGLLGAFDAARENSPAVRCVARPEMFTDGASLAWLERAIEGVTDHICLSDGTALKLIPGLRNHLFTYGLQSRRGWLEFQKLMRRAPELLGQFHSQINSFHRGTHAGRAADPLPWVLSREEPAPATLVWFYELYLNPHSLEDSAERMLDWGTLEAPPLSAYRSIDYVPLTECAASDAEFQAFLVERVNATYFDPGVCLLLRLPPGEAEVTQRMRIALAGIGAAKRHVPQTRASNIFLLSGDLGDDTLIDLAPRLRWHLHHSVDYWRHPVALYEASLDITLFLDRQWTSVPETAKAVTTEIFGRAPRFVLAARTPDVDGFADA